MTGSRSALLPLLYTFKKGRPCDFMPKLASCSQKPTKNLKNEQHVDSVAATRLQSRPRCHSALSFFSKKRHRSFWDTTACLESLGQDHERKKGARRRTRKKTRGHSMRRRVRTWNCIPKLVTTTSCHPSYSLRLARSNCSVLCPLLLEGAW